MQQSLSKGVAQDPEMKKGIYKVTILFGLVPLCTWPRPTPHDGYKKAAGELAYSCGSVWKLSRQSSVILIILLHSWRFRVALVGKAVED